MYQEIKKMADEAVALQNKLQMENALRTISSICDGARELEAKMPAAAPSVDDYKISVAIPYSDLPDLAAAVEATRPKKGAKK